MRQNAFIRNRAEEFDRDVWSTYVLPLYFPQLGLHEARKSQVLEGGRGCGKTALLRYLSYPSQFSPSRMVVPQAAFQTIGLYLKADSTYFSGFTGYGKSEQHWQDIFEHALCLALAEQIVGSMRALNCTSERLGRYGQLQKLDFKDAVQGFAGDEVPADLAGFERWLRLQRQLLSKWFKNFESTQPPTLLPLTGFLGALIEELRSKLTYLSSSVFAVYVDEYENLLDYQQRFVNTMIKGGEPPLIFHVAMKPNGMRTRQTIGTESIQETADYRLIPLDEYLKPTFNLFCAELFFFRLISETELLEELTPVSTQNLQDAGGLEKRKVPEYQKRVLDEINRILPGQRYGVVAAEVLRDSALRRRWDMIVGEALKDEGSTLTSEEFQNSNFPEESVVNAALLHQRSKRSKEIHDEFTNLRTGKPSKYKSADWTHHFLVGTLLLMYLPLRQKPCPIYAGFEAFAQLSGTSVRHFLELCHLSIGDTAPRDSLVSYCVPVKEQAEAAVRASRKFRGEVSSFGDQGNRLLAVVNLLGKLFRLSHARYSQSEAERTHFSIVGEELTAQADQVLKEALKWSVLLKVPETKVKGNRYESDDYILNPIYAPFFGLSYNKGRKLEMPTAEAETMLAGKLDDFTKLLRQYEIKWGADSGDQFSLGLES
jgi:hypothetical protein